VIRPSLLRSASQRAIGRNLALDLLVAVGMGVTMALINAILPTVARRGGLAPIELSALAAAPFIANLLGAFAGRFGPRNTAQLTLLRGAGSASLLLLFLVPSAPVMVAVAIVFWLSLSFGGPFHLRLWGAMYPARLRGRVVGVIGMGRAAAGALARSPAASWPTGSVARAPSPWPGSSASPARSATWGCERQGPTGRWCSPPASRSAPSASVQSSAASLSPRASTVVA